MKSDMLEVKFESNVNGVPEEIASHGNVETAAVWASLECAARGT